MAKKILLFLVLIMVLTISTVYAQSEEVRFYHPRDTNLTIYEKCRVDGSVCDSSYDCNISILSPDQQIIINNEAMLGESIYRNFSLLEDNQSSNGLYEVTVDCTNATNSGSNTFYYEVTPNGSQPIDEGQGLILLGSIFLLIIISCSLGFMGIKSSNTTISLSFLAFSTLVMVFTLGLILNVIELSFGTFSEIISNYSSIYVLFTILLTVGAIGLILYIIFVALNMYWRFRGLKDEFSIRT